LIFARLEGSFLMKITHFRQFLLDWNARENTRRMPWKGEKDPYKIWLSEVILQQTRVEQGLAYYERFVDSFPGVGDLASAPEEKVFKLWEGLGYYTRCKNLIHTARFIAKDRKGHFPDTYEDILGLKGVGSYTASAIASFAYGLPHAVVDGNVLRVLSRFFGISEPVDTAIGKKRLTTLADACLDRENPGIYNQALMDFGAVVCKPANPSCGTCPLNGKCVAFKQGTVDLLPVKSKRLVRRDRHFIYIVAEYRGGVYVRKRTEKDIWQNLFEFIGHELQGEADGEDYHRLLKMAWFKSLIGKTAYEVLEVSPVYRQLLTHQQVKARFVKIRLGGPLPSDRYTRVGKEALAGLAFPRLTLVWLQKN
jgi:A/G-specific adenine glycosylase